MYVSRLPFVALCNFFVFGFLAQAMETTDMRDKQNKKHWRAKKILVHYSPAWNDLSATYGGTTGVQHHRTGNDKHCTLMTREELDRNRIHEMRHFLAAPNSQRSRARSETARSRVSASTYASEGSSWTYTPNETVHKVVDERGHKRDGPSSARKQRDEFKKSLSKSYLKKMLGETLEANAGIGDQLSALSGQIKHINQKVVP